jgi:hypothetical protein
MNDAVLWWFGNQNINPISEILPQIVRILRMQNLPDIDRAAPSR